MQASGEKHLSASKYKQLETPSPAVWQPIQPMLGFVAIIWAESPPPMDYTQL